MGGSVIGDTCAGWRFAIKLDWRSISFDSSYTTRTALKREGCRLPLVAGRPGQPTARLAHSVRRSHECLFTNRSSQAVSTAAQCLPLIQTQIVTRDLRRHTPTESE